MKKEYRFNNKIIVVLENDYVNFLLFTDVLRQTKAKVIQCGSYNELFCYNKQFEIDVVIIGKGVINDKNFELNVVKDKLINTSLIVEANNFRKFISADDVWLISEPFDDIQLLSALDETIGLESLLLNLNE